MIAGRKIRLTGFDAPELSGACPAEENRAIAARDALHDWLNAGAFALDGGGEPPRDRYGRELRAARRGDILLGDLMIDRQLAQASGWGSGWGVDRDGWCP